MSSLGTRDARAYALKLAGKQVAELCIHEPGVRLGEEPEELHDMRVAIRRLRTLIQVFSEQLPWSLVAQAEELRRMGVILGSVRDADLQTGFLRTKLAATDPDDAAPLAELLAVLEKQRRLARAAMLDALSSLRYRQLVGALQVALVLGTAAEGEETSVGDWAGRALPVAYRRFRRRARIITSSSPAEKLHSLRKRAKRMRYTVEFARGLYGARGERMVSAVEALQDVLGEHQDAVAANHQLRTLALDEAAGLSRAAVLSAGGLIAGNEQRMWELRLRLPASLKSVKDAWKPLRRKL